MKWELKRYPMYYGGVQQTYPNIKPGETFLSRSVVVGNLIFLSGTTGRDLKTGQVADGPIEQQVKAALDNIRAALEEAGSSLNNLVKQQIFLKRMSDSPRLWKAIMEYYRENAPELAAEPPAVTVGEATSLDNPKCLVEISCIAIVSRDQPGWELKKYPLYYGQFKQAYPDIKPGQPFMSAAVSVGNLLFLSAMSGEDAVTGQIETDNFEEQWTIALNKVSSIMDKAGSSLSNIINTLHFAVVTENPATGKKDKVLYGPAVDGLWKAELEYFEKHSPFLLEEFPASTFLKVSGLSNPAALGQTEVTGVISRYMPGWEVKNYPTYIALRGFPRHISEIKKQYSNTVRVGNLILIAGQTPIDAYTAGIETDVFEKQAEKALRNLKEAAEETGCFLDNLVSTHVLMPDPANLATFRRIELDFYRKYAPRLLESPPTTTVVHPAGLASPRFGVEIEAIGYLPVN